MQTRSASAANPGAGPKRAIFDFDMSVPCVTEATSVLVTVSDGLIQIGFEKEGRNLADPGTCSASRWLLTLAYGPPIGNNARSHGHGRVQLISSKQTNNALHFFGTVSEGLSAGDSKSAGGTTMSLNRASSWSIGERSMLDFTVPSTDRHLPSLSIYSQQLKDLDEWLLMYIATLEQGQSVAVNRGETLSASYLCQQLGRLFTTAEPDMVRGPRIDWMQVVLSQDSLSSNTEEDTYTLGESVVRISTQDMDLISSGRPRQFLTPWPPTPDIQKEVNILSVVADELGDLMRALTSCK